MKKVAIILAAVIATACTSTQKADTSPATQANQQNSNTLVSVAAPNAETAENKLATELLALQKESLYFDFDKSTVKPVFQNAVMKQVEFIKSHGEDIVTLEGNADERGSKEYNQALGERRAHAVKKALQALGIPAKQIKTVSHGKENPRLTCHEEKCWAENRRVDFVHSVK